MLKVSIDEIESNLRSLLESVEKDHKWVRVCRNGTPIADIRPAAYASSPLVQDPKLAGVEFNEDPVLPLAPEDWPEDCR